MARLPDRPEPTRLLVVAGVVLAGLAVAGALDPLSQITCGFCDESGTGARLVLPRAYLLLSPLLGALDAIVFLALPQHYALMGTGVVGFVVWRLRRRSSLRRRTFVRAVAHESAVAVVGVAGLVGLYAAAVAFPRPQARLVLDDPHELIVNFHSHTRHSHDVRESFTAAHNRSWHTELGFDATYVTDHATLRGVADPQADDAHRGATRVLPGVELRLDDTHVVLLGLRQRDTIHFDRGRIDIASLAALRASHDTPIPALLCLPGPLDPALWPIRFDGIGAVDAAPRGLAVLDRERLTIASLRSDLDIPLVSATNNHGWFPGGVAWSVVRIPGWREMSDPELDLAIREHVVGAGAGGVRVVERARVAGAAHPVALAATVPSLVWHVARGLTLAERLVWFAWGLVLAGGPVVVRRAAARARAYRVRDVTLEVAWGDAETRPSRS